MLYVINVDNFGSAFSLLVFVGTTDVRWITYHSLSKFILVFILVNLLHFLHNQDCSPSLLWSLVYTLHIFLSGVAWFWIEKYCKLTHLWILLQVENGFKGNSFPVIIADATICRDLRVLESDFDGDGTTDAVSEDQVGPRSREEVLHFLNELGWLFQRKNLPSKSFLTNFSSKRFSFLLIFSVERDWAAVVKTVLDMLVEKSLARDNSLVQESLEMLLEIQLLSRAVKRKCRRMVDLLLQYSVKGSTSDSKIYLFPPNSAGPGGITPLHLAASVQDSEDMVNALTDDPQEVNWTLL